MTLQEGIQPPNLDGVSIYAVYKLIMSLYI